MTNINSRVNAVGNVLQKAYLWAFGIFMILLMPEAAFASGQGGGLVSQIGQCQQTGGLAGPSGTSSLSTAISNTSSGVGSFTNILTNGITYFMFLVFIVFIGYAGIVALKYFGAHDQRKMEVASENLKGLLIGAAVCAGAFLIRSVVFGILCGSVA